MKLEFLKEKKKEILIGVAIIGIIIFSLISNSRSFTKERDEQDMIFEEEYQAYEEELNLKTNIYIHLDGAVKKRGLIELKEGDRLETAITKADGLLENADLRYVNLAMILSDGEKIYIPTTEELVDYNSGVSYISELQVQRKININTASLEELQNIPGVGPSTANNIVNYRTKNGKFKKIEDIKNVSGIGESKFESMLEYISI